jgi:lysophospholipase L1-like esterase
VVHSRPALIVVLGSSTSAGTGPSDPNNAWVPRYRAYLQQRFPAFGLTNLAVGGFTTYHVQPSDFIPPTGRPTPVAGKNITAALALKPDAIIVNLPSNDAAAHVPLAEQLANYQRLGELASAAHVPLWVSTSQPRNFGDGAQRALLTQASDGIQRRFAPRVLDFWTPFADAAGRIEPEHDSGDGTHLNDAAHARLLEIVVAAQVPEAVLRTP